MIQYMTLVISICLLIGSTITSPHFDGKESSLHIHQERQGECMPSVVYGTLKFIHRKWWINSNTGSICSSISFPFCLPVYMSHTWPLHRHLRHSTSAPLLFQHSWSTQFYHWLHTSLLHSQFNNCPSPHGFMII